MPPWSTHIRGLIPSKHGFCARLEWKTFSLKLRSLGFSSTCMTVLRFGSIHKINVLGKIIYHRSTTRVSAALIAILKKNWSSKIYTIIILCIKHAAKDYERIDSLLLVRNPTTLSPVLPSEKSSQIPHEKSSFSVSFRKFFSNCRIVFWWIWKCLDLHKRKFNAVEACSWSSN